MRGVCARCRERGKSSSGGSTPQKNHHMLEGAIGAPLDVARLMAPMRAGRGRAPARRIDARSSSATRPAYRLASCRERHPQQLQMRMRLRHLHHGAAQARRTARNPTERSLPSPGRQRSVGVHNDAAAPSAHCSSEQNKRLSHADVPHGHAACHRKQSQSSPRRRGRGRLLHAAAARAASRRRPRRPPSRGSAKTTPFNRFDFNPRLHVCVCVRAYMLRLGGFAWRLFATAS